MVVTSFGDKGWHQYGKRFVQTFLERWPEEEKLLIYYENMPDDAIKDDRVEWIHLFEDVPGMTDFLQTIKDSDKIFQGVSEQERINPETNKPEKGNQYDYRYDVYKFSRKVFAICDAVVRCEERFLAWIDADTITHSDVPDDFIADRLKPGTMLAYLGRDWSYSECGFMAFDLAHDMADDFFSMYKGILTTGAFRWAGEWHDSFLFDFVRELTGVPTSNISATLKFEHPFINSVLGLYMDHMKGARKEVGRSPKQEGINNEAHPYWGGLTQKEHVA